MAERARQIADFLSAAGWAGAACAPLAGDASNRRYFRLARGDGEGAVLMDAPPGRGEDIRSFVAIARHLVGLGLSAPVVLAQDPQAGLLLLEDLGDALFARVLEAAPEREHPLYAAATDLLAELHRHPPPPGLAAYDPPTMTALAALAFDWYRAGATEAHGTGSKSSRPSSDRSQLTAAHSDEDAPEARAGFCAALMPLLERHTAAEVLILRDYHAENLIWLPEREGHARVGLLDFQDAMTGGRAYDLVSLLQDARRDVPPALEEAMLARYIAACGQDAAAFRTAYALLGAQRNLRIVGVFARLCLRDGKRRYLALIPRVWGYLMRDLDHPVLAPLRVPVIRGLPAPTPETLARLERQCATAPAR